MNEKNEKILKDLNSSGPEKRITENLVKFLLALAGIACFAFMIWGWLDVESSCKSNMGHPSLEEGVALVFETSAMGFLSVFLFIGGSFLLFLPFSSIFYDATGMKKPSPKPEEPVEEFRKNRKFFYTDEEFAKIPTRFPKRPKTPNY